jgi:hypothetical protein
MPSFYRRILGGLRILCVHDSTGVATDSAQKEDIPGIGNCGEFRARKPGSWHISETSIVPEFGCESDGENSR